MTGIVRRSELEPRRSGWEWGLLIGLTIMGCGLLGTFLGSMKTRVGVVWTVMVADTVLATPAVQTGLVYVGSDDGNVYALENDSGRLAWKFFRAYPLRAAPRVAYGLVYAGCDDGHLYALDALTGQEVWSVATRGPVSLEPALEEGVLYFTDDGNVVRAVDALTGVPRWKYFSPAAIAQPLAVAGPRVFLVNREGQVVALSSSDGTPLWETDFAGALLTQPVMVGEKVYVGADTAVYAPAAESGKPLPGGADTDAGAVYALAPESGKPLRLYPAESAVTTRVESDGRWLCFGTVEGQLYFFHLSTGQLVWQYRTSGPLYAPPLLVGTTLYIGCNDGFLYAFNAATGRLRWRLRTGAEITAGCAADSKYIYFASWSGEIGAVRR